ncbi:MAG TPA: hypothetical protein VFQ15_05230 [Jiangellaceae bacterium]|nr:hypothetical protein [Jiangellaceae bacterium]
MNVTQTITPPVRMPQRGRIRRNWPAWVPYAAALWSLGYGVVALVWTLSGSGFPLGENDPGGNLSMLGEVSAEVGAPLFAAVALGGAGIAMLMARVRSLAELPPWWRRIAIWFGSVMAVLLLAVVPDGRVLAVTGYLPLIIVVAPFNAEFRDRIMENLGAADLNLLAVIIGGFLWAMATLAFARRTAGLCVRCGRGEREPAWATPAAAARWGRWPTYVAAVIPAVYAATRWTWVLGYPMGIDAEFHAEGMASGELWAGAWLGTFGLIGTVLTLGLVKRWGEVFPRWMPRIGGRAVPVGLAVVPATFVSVIVFNGGTSMIIASSGDGVLALDAENWAALGPVLLWPVWGIALGAATLAYYLRRRGQCSTCGRG